MYCSLIVDGIFSFASGLLNIWCIILYVVYKSVLTRVLFIHYCQYKVESCLLLGLRRTGSNIHV